MWLILVQAFSSLAYYGYVPLIPLIENELYLTNTQIGWMTSAVFLGSSLIAIPSGVITDRIGATKTLLLFMLILITVLLSFSLVNDYLLVLLLLFLLGVGYGGITPGTNKSIMENFNEFNRGTAMGIKQMGVSIGSALGTLILPVIAGFVGWRYSLFYIALLLVIMCLFHYKMLNEPNLTSKRANFAENIKQLLNNRKLIKIIVVIVFFIWVQLSVMTYLVLYLKDQNLSFSAALFCLALLQIGGVIGRAGWGFISDRYFNREREIILTMVAILSGIFVIVLCLISSHLLFIVTCFLVLMLGITTQGWNGIFVLMVSEVVPKELIGLASGLGLSFVYLGAVFGTPISGWIIDMSGSYKIMWLTCGIIILIIGLKSYSFRKT